MLISKSIIKTIFLSLLTFPVFAGKVSEWFSSYSGGIGTDGFYYYKTPAIELHKDFQSSLFYDFTLKKQHKNSMWVLSPFGRLDFIDNQRTHIDIREGYYNYFKKKVEFNLGIKNYAWGKTLGFSVVDIANQMDIQEGFIEKKKLGQLALDLSYQITKSLQLKVYGFTGFRHQFYPDLSSRQAFTSLEISNNNIRYKSNLKEWQPDFASRLIYYGSNLELTVGYFYGTARNPYLEITPDYKFAQFYTLIHQPFTEFQYNLKGVLLKSEVAYRFEENEDYWSVVGEAEYTFYNIFKSGLDMMIYLEYLYNENMEARKMPFSDDFLGGIKLDINDLRNSFININVMKDRTKIDSFMSVEIGTRFGNKLKTKLTYRDMITESNLTPNSPNYVLAKSGNFGAVIHYFF